MAMLHAPTHPPPDSLTYTALDEDVSIGSAATTLLAALDELRRRLLIALGSLMLAVVICFSFSHFLVEQLMGPIENALPSDAVLIATRIPEIFLLHVRVSLLAAVVVVLPVWLYHLGAVVEFVFRERAKTAFAPVAGLGYLLFAVGAAFAHFVLFPLGVRFLTTFGSDTVHVMLSVGEVFSLYGRFVLGIGAAFQVPTIVYVLSRVGLVTPRQMLRWWRPVILAAFVLAAVITPTPDLVTQSFLAIPLVFLYGISIVLCWLVRRNRSRTPGGMRVAP